ncbi:gp53-like domain-containing protein [Methylorubrum populi]
MALFGPSTATATVAANTNAVTVTGMDLTVVTPGMTISLGARDRKKGDAWIIGAVAANGTNGGTLTLAGSVPDASTNVPFVIDTTGYLGTDASYAAAIGLAILSTLATLFGVATNLYSGARQLVLDKVSGSTVGRIAFAIAGRSWGDIAHRTLTYTPTGGQAASTETLALRAFPDGTTPTDALVIDLSAGTGDLRQGTATMASASTVDLGSAPAGKVLITGTAAITSFGPGKNLERRCFIVDGGAVLKHAATSLSLPGRADIATAAGDQFVALSDSAGNWRVTSYQRASGKPLILPSLSDLGAQAALGFTPIQQGGGGGQGENKIYLGYSSALSSLRAQVDATDFGRVWTDYAAGNVLAGAGYQKFPNGLILQWSSVQVSDADFTATFPIAFPNACFGVVPAVTYPTGSDTAYAVSVDDVRKNLVNLRCRVTRAGTTQAQGALPVRYLAWGY